MGYRTHPGGSDDTLLERVAHSFAHLEHLEVHRYRRARTEQTPYRHIAEILAGSRSLRTVRLNLDFHDDHQAYCGNPIIRQEWFRVIQGGAGVAIMQACPRLEYVALLYHGRPASVWAEFHPERCAEPRFVLKYDDAYVDSEPIQREWCLA
ncbi:hypothetical protein LXA43DRAFT_1093441 [Ganoderma leucocontextum]|nr:hypothetical protein LXA43DRAFT_1093441 [Ganoderma leucocontextum]